MTGPTVKLTINKQNIEEANFVQEALAIIGFSPATSYALLGYIPVDPMSVQVFKDGVYLLQGVDYTIDGRKIQFTTAFTGDGGNPEAAVENCRASYITTNEVASIPAVTIAFDIPGQSVRVNGTSGLLQILVDGTWYDMYPEADPITGDITLVPSQDPSPNQ